MKHVLCTMRIFVCVSWVLSHSLYIEQMRCLVFSLWLVLCNTCSSFFWPLYGGIVFCVTMHHQHDNIVQRTNECYLHGAYLPSVSCGGWCTGRLLTNTNSCEYFSSFIYSAWLSYCTQGGSILSICF